MKISLKPKLSHHIKRFIYIDILGIIAGFIGGLGAIIFREFLKLNKWLFFSILLPLISFKVNGFIPSIIILPALGGLIVGPIIFKFAPETKGHGVPEVIEAIKLHHARIRKRVVFVKIFASSITIGSGGSAGREGPIAQIGASIGSLLSELLNIGARERRLLVVSGLSAGIAGTFNAPLGGAIFGLEILLGGVTLTYAIPIILASVIGAAVVSSVYGPYPAFYAPPTLTFTNPIELFFYFLLGLIFGLLAVIWVKIFYLFEDFYDKLRVPNYLKLSIGGIITGTLGMFYIQYGILGVGYEGINKILLGEVSLTLLLILGTLKLFATANTIGSGGSGGVFAPSLFIGAAYGGAIGLIFHSLFPGIVKHPFTYSLAGMAALFAAAAHAPISMIVMIPEMSNDYSLLPPLMAACATSYIVSKIIMGDSNIYTLKLKRRGVKLFLAEDFSAFEILKVEEFMTKNVITVSPETNLSRVYEIIRETHHDCFPVVEHGKLIGRVSSDDVLAVPVHLLPKCTVKDVMRKNYSTIFRDDPIIKAIEKIYYGGEGKLFVVERNNPQKIVGILTKTDIVKAYGYVSTI